MPEPVVENDAPWVDPIVAEVRATRERLMERVGDLHTLCELLRAREGERGRQPNVPPAREPGGAGQAA